jgi:hypothetical protein
MSGITRMKVILRELIDAHDILSEGLTAVYVFGSHARGEEKEKSDIDIAFVFEDSFYKAGPFGAFQEAELLASEIGARMGMPVDTTVLNGASLTFAYNVIRDGACIYERNMGERIMYEINMENKYQDFFPFVRELREIKRRAVIGRD